MTPAQIAALDALLTNADGKLSTLEQETLKVLYEDMKEAASLIRRARDELRSYDQGSYIADQLDCFSLGTCDYL